MSEHLLAEQIERYRQRVMSPTELLMADDHLVTCDSCRLRLTDTGRLETAIPSLLADLQAETRAKPNHLLYEQLAGYVDDSLDEVDREIVETHLQGCRLCTTELHDLQTFKAAMNTPSVKEPAVVAEPTPWEKFVAFWRVTAHRIPLQVATTLAIAGVLFLTAILMFRKEVADLRVQLSELQQANVALQKQVSTVSDLKAQLAQLRQQNDRIQQDYRTAQTTVSDLRTQLARLQPSQLPSSSSQVWIALNDRSRRIVLDQQGNLEGLEAFPLSYQRTVKNVLTTQRLETPSLLASLIGRAGTLMGGSGEGVSFALLSPVGTVVESDRPTLRWRPLNEATSYTVTVYDSNFNSVATSPSLPGTEWTVPRALQRGAIYSWQVTALKDGREMTSPRPPAPEARFGVLEQQKANDLGRAKETYSDSHLVLGILYGKNGLLDDAEQEFQALLDANPRSPVPQKLLRNLKALRRP
jgi:hypothetical protein